MKKIALIIPPSPSVKVSIDRARQKLAMKQLMREMG